MAVMEGGICVICVEGEITKMALVKEYFCGLLFFFSRV